ncbi:hypothetical protein A6R68_23673, partial [Neotoma lepida]
MNLHQVLTGAVNPGDHCFSVGSVGEQRFTDDCLLKVWYNVENWRPAVTSPDKNSEKQSQGEIDFSFVYLA